MPVIADRTQDVLREVRRMGGAANARDIAQRLGVPSRALERALQTLVESQELTRYGKGQYALSDPAQLDLPDIARDIVTSLNEGGVEAHLTGFDVIARLAHQFTFALPHIVYVEPYAMDAARASLSAEGFVVVDANQGGKVDAPDTSRVVLLRKQADAGRRFGVIGHVAPREKAWVDLLREARKGRLSFDFGELGRLLRRLLDEGGDQGRLRRYAARLGYAEWVEAATGGNAHTDDMQRLVSGFRAV